MFCSLVKKALVCTLSFACLAAGASCVQQPSSEKQPTGVGQQTAATPQPAAKGEPKPHLETPKEGPAKSALADKTGESQSGGPQSGDPPKSLAVTDNEEQWTKFNKEATKEYGLNEAQAQGAEAALQSCLKRAEARRQEYKEAVRVAEQAKDAAAHDKADGALRAALVKLGDETVARIDAIATVEQVEKAAKAGFESPRRKNPGAKPEVGFVAPPWELKYPDGKPVSLASLKGKVVVLHFWATWCGFCKKSMPEMAKLYDSVKDNPKVVIYGINCSQRANNPDPVAYAKEQGCSYQVLLNGDDVSQAYEVHGFPTLFVIGPDGKVVYKERGMQPDVTPRLEPVIKKALEDSVKQAKG